MGVEFCLSCEEREASNACSTVLHSAREEKKENEGEKKSGRKKIRAKKNKAEKKKQNTYNPFLERNSGRDD